MKFSCLLFSGETLLKSRITHEAATASLVFTSLGLHTEHSTTPDWSKLQHSRGSTVSFMAVQTRYNMYLDLFVYWDTGRQSTRAQQTAFRQDSRPPHFVHLPARLPQQGLSRHVSSCFACWYCATAPAPLVLDPDLILKPLQRPPGPPIALAVSQSWIRFPAS